LRALRLDLARSELARGNDGGSVTSVAIAHGFGSLSRFAADYKARFHESPSENTIPRQRPALTQLIQSSPGVNEWLLSAPTLLFAEPRSNDHNPPNCDVRGRDLLCPLYVDFVEEPCLKTSRCA
jgi:hypothetical protein